MSIPSANDAPEPSERSAAIFGRYRVLARLGRGGMADVFLTVSTGAMGVAKLAVVKRLRADIFREEDPQAGAKMRAMFLAEATLSSGLNHPNIIHTYDVGEDDDALFMAMEYVEGQSLSALQTTLKRANRSLSPAMSVRILCDVLSGLHYAHELQDLSGAKLDIVHRDVSPQNVMLTYDGGVKLLDFGVAKMSSTSAVATEIGTIKGKIRYMSPEQVTGVDVDRRADIFAVGVVLWELLSGTRLVRGPNDAGALLSLIQDNAPSLLVAAPSVDPGLASTVMRALSRVPSERFATALEMRTALETYLSTTAEHVTAESIGALMRETFASHRESMARRIQNALRDGVSVTDLGAVAEWDPETGSGPSASKLLSRSASRSIAMPRQSHAEVPVAEITMPLVAAPPARRHTPIFVLLVLLGIVAGVAITLWSLREPAPVMAQAAPPVLAVPDAPPSALLPVGPIDSPLPQATSPAPAEARPAVPASPGSPAAARPAAATPAGKPRKEPGSAAPEQPTKTAETPKSAASTESGLLSLDSYPWTKVSENGRVLGTTPLLKLALPAGVHTLTLENSAENIRETVVVTIKPGETTSKRLAF